MPNRTYVVIGSNCFTGSHIVDALLTEPDNRVIGISRSSEYRPLFLPYKRREASGFQFHQLDIVRQSDELVELLDSLQPEVIVNVAALSEVALSNERPVEYFDVNMTAVVKLCDQLRSRSYLERYVHVSSAEVFGTCPEPVKEDAPFRPSTPYAASKAAAEMYLSTLLSNFEFPVTIIRSTNVYGRHQQLFKIIPRTVIYLKLGRTVQLQGGGKAAKSFIHVRDVTRGVLLAAQRGRPGAYHFTVPNEQTVGEIVRQICEWMGYDFEEATSVVPDRLGQDARYWLDWPKAERELGWTPGVSFEEGVKEVIQWVEGNWDEIQGLPLEYQHKV